MFLQQFLGENVYVSAVEIISGIVHSEKHLMKHH